MVIDVDRTVDDSTSKAGFSEFDLSDSEEAGGWLRWCPTSMAMLRAAERKIFSYIKTPFKSKYIDIGSTVGKTENNVWTLMFNTESKKLPLVLIHGFASGVGLWCLNLDSFAASRPVYAFDLLGFGRSSRPRFSSNALEAESQLIESIEEWRKQVGLEKFVLLGHSMGGFLASSYALRFPERVSHLVLADPWGFPEIPTDAYARSKLPIWVKGIAYLLSPFNPLWIVRATGPFGPRLVQKARPDIVHKFSGVIEEADSVIPHYIYHCNAQTPSGESAFHAMMESFGWAKYPMINRICALKSEVPLTFIYGARSWVDRHPGQQLKDMRKDVTVHIINGAGHHVYADNYHEFNSMVLNACQSAESGAVTMDDLDKSP